MQLVFFKSLFLKLSSLVDSIQKSFENSEKKASENPLYKSFSLYTKEDLKLALDLLKNGYEPTTLQKQKFYKSLADNASNNEKFIFNIQSYFELIPTDVFAKYCVSHNLSANCNNDKTVFVNFESVIKQFSEKEGFSSQVYSELKSSIFNYALKVISIKPKYESLHSFEFTKEDKEVLNKFKTKIYNSLVLIPYMVQTMDEFVSLRTTIEQSVSKVENYVQSHNVRVHYDGGSSYYNKSNRMYFQLDLLHNWENFIREYDTKKLQQDLIAQIKEPINHNQKETSVISSEVISSSQILEDKINELKIKLTPNQQEQINRIQSLYETIYSDMFEKKSHHELDSLYTNLPEVIEKFLSIHPDYRDTLKNVEGKSPEQLMLDSLNMIETKLNLYWEDINQNKVTDLSIVQRTIKMKS